MPVKAVCVHGHFYQPPRENPLTGKIPGEPGASPFSNWNERIHHECYVPNAILGNFSRISHDIGPTLMRWMSAYDTETYRRLVGQGTGGAAMAQSYNHTILPLDSPADQAVQVSWGIYDFQHRYGRKPRGMWLPETAADVQTLAVLAEYGIEYTILAPWQAATQRLDYRLPYRIKLPTGRSIVAFFYQGSMSGGVSFNSGMTMNADNFVASHLLPHYDEREGPQMVMVSSDGELYGHHKKDREHFLSYLTRHAAPNAGVRVMTPEQWLDNFPVTRTIRIRENTSWSCHHGVARWSTGCDCTGGDPSWKRRMRHSLRDLGDRLDHVYAAAIEMFDIDAWELRHRYIEVMLGDLTIEELAHELAPRLLTVREIRKVELLLRAQRMRQFMLTSCGWFFDGLGLEARNNLLYARKAVELTTSATGLQIIAKRQLEPHTYLTAEAA